MDIKIIDITMPDPALLAPSVLVVPQTRTRTAVAAGETSVCIAAAPIGFMGGIDTDTQFSTRSGPLIWSPPV